MTLGQFLLKEELIYRFTYSNWCFLISFNFHSRCHRVDFHSKVFVFFPRFLVYSHSKAYVFHSLITNLVMDTIQFQSPKPSILDFLFRSHSMEPREQCVRSISVWYFTNYNQKLNATREKCIFRISIDGISRSNYEERNEIQQQQRADTIFFDRNVCCYYYLAANDRISSAGQKNQTYFCYIWHRVAIIV